MFDRLSGYKKALIIGTGGGNDIVSALIPFQHIIKMISEVDIAGVLSPAAVHLFDGREEEVFNSLSGSIKRIIQTPSSDIYIPFIDDALEGIIKNSSIKCPKLYDISIRYGSKQMIEGINNIIKENGYDVLIAVDVGGDILARGKEDKYILSPLMDFSILKLLGETDIDSYLIEFGLLTDGELRPEGADEIFDEFKERDIILEEYQLSANDHEIKIFKEIYSSIKKIRAGHTANMTLETLDNIGKNIISEYRFRSQINRKKWYTPFEVKLPSKYSGKIYMFDGKKISSVRETTFDFLNPLDQIVKIKSNYPYWKTELDLFYLWSDENWTTSKKQGLSLFLLLPSLNIPSNQREEIIKYGLKNTVSDLILILKEDSKYVNGCKQINAEKFTLLTKSVINVDNIAREITKYQSK